MKKDELLGKLATEFSEVGFPVVNESYFKNQRTKTYEVKVVRKNKDGTTASAPQKVLFYVMNEDQVDEEALFINNDPVGCDKFEVGLKAYLATNPFSCENYDVIKVMREEQYAIVNAFSSSNGDINENAYFVYKSGEDFTHKPYTGKVEIP